MSANLNLKLNQRSPSAADPSSYSYVYITATLKVETEKKYFLKIRVLLRDPYGVDSWENKAEAIIQTKHFLAHGYRVKTIFLCLWVTPDKMDVNVPKSGDSPSGSWSVTPLWTGPRKGHKYSDVPLRILYIRMWKTFCYQMWELSCFSASAFGLFCSVQRFFLHLQ